MASCYILESTTNTGERRWQVRFENSNPPLLLPNGKRRRIIILGTFKVERHAKARQKWALEEWAAGRVPTIHSIASPDYGATVNKAAQDWLASRIDLAPLTLTAYTQKADAIADYFKGRPARDITRRDAQAWIADLVAKGAAPGTVGQYANVLRQILDYADVDPNPMRDKRVRRPVVGSGGRMRLPSRNDLNLIRSYLRNETDEWLLIFLEQSGCRISEAVRIRWRDIDHEHRRVHVLGAKTRAGTQKWRWVADDPPLAPLTILPRPDDAADDDLVYPRTDKAFQRAMTDACRRAGTRTYSPHDLRHLHASRLIRAGVDPVSVAARLGHARPSMALDVYSHVDIPD